MMHRLRVANLLPIAFLAASAACSSSAQEGGEGQHCFRNGTCDSGLMCVSNICVLRPADGGRGGGRGGTTGGGGAGGTVGSGGSVGGAGGTAGNAAGTTGSAGTTAGSAGTGGATAGTAGSTGGGTAGAGTAGTGTAGAGTAGTGTAGAGTAGTGTAGRGGSTGAGGTGTASPCGNGVKEANEGCDCGTNNNPPYPAGCQGPNGLLFGDATGCTKTCTKEPTCRSAGGVTQACATSCGNGSIETGEGCDDGNNNPGDGCSPACTVEAGFVCSVEIREDTAACTQPGNVGQCLQLPVIYRDFKNESVAGGHSDFFFLGAAVANPVTISGVDGQTGAITFNKRYCVPNAGGPAKKADASNRSWDLAMPNLAANGKPVFNSARPGGTNANCQFIDWSHNGNGGRVPGIQVEQSPTYGITYVDGAQFHPMYRGPAPIVTSATTFAEWWVDSTYTGNTHTVGTLELGPLGGSQYRYASQVNSVMGGFYPLDPPGQFPLHGAAVGAPGAGRMVGTETLLCNIWPYWHSAATFGAGYNCRGDQYLSPPSLFTSLTAPYVPANFNTTINMMYPGGLWYTGVQGWFHNFWFTDEMRMLFTHTGPFSLQFGGDDDTFVFINGVLVVDLGGIHQRLPGRVDVSSTGMATIIEGGSLDATGTNILPCPSADPYTALVMNSTTNTDGFTHANCTIANCDCRTRTVDLGLQLGRAYEIAVFGADRHPTESNYQLTVSGLRANRSSCTRSP